MPVRLGRDTGSGIPWEDWGLHGTRVVELAGDPPKNVELYNQHLVCIPSAPRPEQKVYLLISASGR